MHSNGSSGQEESKGCGGSGGGGDREPANTKNSSSSDGGLGIAQEEMKQKMEENSQQQSNKEEGKDHTIEFRKNELVRYKEKETVTLVGVHPDPEETYYTIRREDGVEVNTVRKHIRRLATAYFRR
mmetsp:Transcript_25204/g.42213  ORF Transcript_25204/g.42213 Transcript_25204/m.42213 type:complete len:126 (+) Transcript_25204:78-455(+)